MLDMCLACAGLINEAASVSLFHFRANFECLFINLMTSRAGLSLSSVCESAVPTTNGILAVMATELQVTC